MSRHRGVRNRQFSYDEGEDDYYDDDEEAAAACEEHRQHMLEARGDGAASSGTSLASYFDLPKTMQQTQKQQQREQQQQHVDGSRAGGGKGKTAAATHLYAGTPNAPVEDGELVAAIAAELGRRLGPGRFSAEQLRQAVVNSDYEVDTAEVILLTTDQSAHRHHDAATPRPGSENQPFTPSPAAGAAAAHFANTDNVVPPPPGFQQDKTPAGGGGGRELGGTNELSSPSSLAFGLRVDGNAGWIASNGARGATRTTTEAAPPGFSSEMPPPVSATTSRGSGGGGLGVTFAPTFPSAEGGGSSAVDKVVPFEFGTPSPDDLNLFKQTGARTPGTGVEGIGANASGVAATAAAAGPLTPISGGGQKLAILSSPKAKVVHIGTGTTPTSATRKSISAAAGKRGGDNNNNSNNNNNRGSTPAVSRDQSPTEQRQVLSPALRNGGGSGGVGGGTGGARAVVSQPRAEGADDSDEGEAGGKERLAMVVIGHVDAGKSTLMGQVCLLCMMGPCSGKTLLPYDGVVLLYVHPTPKQVMYNSTLVDACREYSLLNDSHTIAYYSYCVPTQRANH